MQLIDRDIFIPLASLLDRLNNCLQSWLVPPGEVSSHAQAVSRVGVMYLFQRYHVVTQLTGKTVKSWFVETMGLCMYFRVRAEVRSCCRIMYPWWRWVVKIMVLLAAHLFQTAIICKCWMWAENSVILDGTHKQWNRLSHYQIGIWSPPDRLGATGAPSCGRSR